MDLNLNTSLKQEQTLSPVMLQSLALLPMSVTELKAYIEHEIESNPALEIPDSDSDENLEQNSREEFDDNADDDEASDRNLQALENSPVFRESLSEHLLKQLGLADVSERTFKIGQMLIGNLDENGFYSVDLKTLFEKTDYTEKEIQETVRTVQSFDPYGICCSDFRESLIVQARCCNMAQSDLKIFSAIVNQYLEQLKAGKFREVSEALHISIEDLQTFFAILKSFTPFPGRIFDNTEDNFAVPEFSIHNKDGNLVIDMNTSYIPALEISAEFLNLSKNLKGPQAKETSVYISSSLQQAKNLIFQIDMRNRTMFKAATALAEAQRDFFLNGPRFLKSLTLKDIAGAIDVHETTMSRLARSKWIETDWGLFEMKYFFSQGVRDEGGESISRNAVKEIISEILSSDSKISDRIVSDILLEKGIKCARRTVAKYRAELNIASGFYRKKNH